MSNPSANGADLVSNLDAGLDRAFARIADQLEVIDEHLQLDEAVMQRVRQRLADFADTGGSVDFVQPLRGDLLGLRET